MGTTPQIGRFHLDPSSQGVPVDKHILVALLRACGGSIALNSIDFHEDVDRVQITRTDMQDPWRTIISLEEPE